jgi:hypothetical protein
LLAVEVANEHYIRSPLKRTGRGDTIHPHGYLSIDVPREGAAAPVELAVRRGETLKARVIDPDGKPVEGVTAMYPGIDATLIYTWNSGREFADGLFQIEGADPERTYRVFFIKPERGLGAVAELKYDSANPEPIEVKLQPTATIKGKLINPDGSPSRGGQATLVLAYGREKKTLSRDERFDRDLVQFYSNFLGQRNFHLHDRALGPQGEFTFDAVLPGAWLYVQANAAGRSANMATPILKPGEVCDLGAITLKEEQQ